MGNGDINEQNESYKVVFQELTINKTGRNRINQVRKETPKESKKREGNGKAWNAMR